MASVSVAVSRLHNVAITRSHIGRSGKLGPRSNICSVFALSILLSASYRSGLLRQSAFRYSRQAAPAPAVSGGWFSVGGGVGYDCGWWVMMRDGAMRCPLIR